MTAREILVAGADALDALSRELRDVAAEPSDARMLLGAYRVLTALQGRAHELYRDVRLSARRKGAEVRGR